LVTTFHVHQTFQLALSVSAAVNALAPGCALSAPNQTYIAVSAALDPEQVIALLLACRSAELLVSFPSPHPNSNVRLTSSKFSAAPSNALIENSDSANPLNPVVSTHAGSRDMLLSVLQHCAHLYGGLCLSCWWYTFTTLLSRHSSCNACCFPLLAVILVFTNSSSGWFPSS
jgi:hypothetical protein